MGRNAVQAAQDYAWEKIASRLLEVYNSLLVPSAASLPR
jgi:hypothetical protein